LAYIRSSAPPANAFSRLYIPILNIPAKDINLRPEYIALLPHANVDSETLITLDDLPPSDSLKSKLLPENTNWILVDHNVLQGNLGSHYSERVHGVIDHHDDEHKVPNDTGSEPRIIEKSGSCSSIVTNYCREAWDAISAQAVSSGVAMARDDASHSNNDAASASLWDAQVAKLVLASVLIDTANLQNQDKVTKHDTDAVHYLEAKIAASTQDSKRFDRDQFFKEISDAKEDIGQLKLHDMLRKDYKQWSEGTQVLGISSIVKNIDFLADKAVEEQYGENKSENFLLAVKAFAEDRRLGMFAIMTTFTSAKGEFRRELFLSATNTECVQAALRFAKNSTTQLGLTRWHGSIENIDRSEDICWHRIWQQGQVQHSRKQVAPLLRQAMSG
jgi:exopolyphosphatase